MFHLLVAIGHRHGICNKAKQLQLNCSWPVVLFEVQTTDISFKEFTLAANQLNVNIERISPCTNNDFCGLFYCIFFFL